MAIKGKLSMPRTMVCANRAGEKFPANNMRMEAVRISEKAMGTLSSIKPNRAIRKIVSITYLLSGLY
jgi:hypothetical protein